MKKIFCLTIIFIFCLSLAACSSDSNKDEIMVNPTTDKISLALTGVDETVADGEQLYFKAVNESDNPILLEDIVILAYDKDLDFLETSSDNEAIELAPGEKSKKFNYLVNGKPEFVKIAGYQYTQNGTTIIDTFDSVQICRNSRFVLNVNNYSDEEILNKEYDKLPLGVNRE